MVCKSWVSHASEGALCDTNKSNCHLCGNCKGSYHIILHDNLEVENTTLYVAYDISLILRILDEMIPNGIKNSIGYQKALEVCEEESGFFESVLLDHIIMYNEFKEQIVLLEFVKSSKKHVGMKTVIGYGIYSY